MDESLLESIIRDAVGIPLGDTVIMVRHQNDTAPNRHLKSTDQYEVVVNLLAGKDVKAYLHFCYDAKLKTVGIWSINVDCSSVGRGLGGLLANAAEKVAKEFKCMTIKAYDTSGIKHHFWEHLGYVTKRHFYEKSVV